FLILFFGLKKIAPVYPEDIFVEDEFKNLMPSSGEKTTGFGVESVRTKKTFFGSLFPKKA
uniref:hypothetical protein n=1 Tax=uncultured Parasutterella sp. TaxID=1263098 RepID=UPI002592DE7A